jgi:phosphatidylserine decarboxylase
MEEIFYTERETGKTEKEKIYGGFFVKAIYSHDFLPSLIKFPFFSKLFGWLQRSRLTKRKILPFIEKYHIDSSEFLTEDFPSFHHFFIRKLKPTCRPIAQGGHVAILPADSRILVFPKIDEADGFYVKGKKFDLQKLLCDDFLFQLFCSGSLAICRLAPVDYHRFHFPCACIPGQAKLINGLLSSVNPIALARFPSILCENKRMLTLLKTEAFDDVLFVEVGATCVGSIIQTYTPHVSCQKGDEKGYFAFGGSTILLLFQPGRIQFYNDLIEASKDHVEVRGKMGQSLGTASLSP